MDAKHLIQWIWVVQSDKWRRILKETNTESNSFRKQELAFMSIYYNQKMVFVAQKVPESFRVTLTSLNYWLVLYFKISSLVRSKKAAIFFLFYAGKHERQKNTCSIFSRLNIKYFIQWNSKGTHFLFLFIWAWFKKGIMWLYFWMGGSRISG